MQQATNNKFDAMQQATNERFDTMQLTINKQVKETNKRFDEINSKVDDIILHSSETKTCTYQQLAELKKMGSALANMEKKIDDIFFMKKVHKYKKRVKEEITQMYSFGVQRKKLTRERFSAAFEKATKELTKTDLTCDTPTIEIDLYFHNSIFGLIGEVTTDDLDCKGDLLVTKLYQLERACVFANYCQPSEFLFAILISPQNIDSKAKSIIETLPNLDMLHDLLLKGAFKTIVYNFNRPTVK